MKWLKQNWGWIVVIIIALVPLVSIHRLISIDFSGAGTSWITMDSVTLTGRGHGGLPKVVTGTQIAVKETGEWAIRWIVIVLSLTPFSILTNIKPSFSVRQCAGITSFVYAFLHLVFFCADKGWIESFKETGYVIGLIATVVMMVLAITSNRRSIRLLRKNWKKIHNMAYFAGILAVLHVMLLEHGDWIPYALILAIGFLLRISVVKQEILKIRGNRKLVLSKG
jgi:sulfoxide reductase heme-binding subunit YedZ